MQMHDLAHLPRGFLADFLKGRFGGWRDVSVEVEGANTTIHVSGTRVVGPEDTRTLCSYIKIWLAGSTRAWIDEALTDALGSSNRVAALRVLANRSHSFVGRFAVRRDALGLVVVDTRTDEVLDTIGKDVLLAWARQLTTADMPSALLDAICCARHARCERDGWSARRDGDDWVVTDPTGAATVTLDPKEVARAWSSVGCPIQRVPYMLLHDAEGSDRGTKSGWRRARRDDRLLVGAPNGATWRYSVEELKAELAAQHVADAKDVATMPDMAKPGTRKSDARATKKDLVILDVPRDEIERAVAMLVDGGTYVESEWSVARDTVDGNDVITFVSPQGVSGQFLLENVVKYRDALAKRCADTACENRASESETATSKDNLSLEEIPLNEILVACASAYGWAPDELWPTSWSIASDAGYVRFVDPHHGRTNVFGLKELIDRRELIMPAMVTADLIPESTIRWAMEIAIHGESATLSHWPVEALPDDTFAIDVPVRGRHVFTAPELVAENLRRHGPSDPLHREYIARKTRLTKYIARKTRPMPQKENPMPEIVKTLKTDATEAAWRTAGSQFTKLAREPLVALLSRHLGADDESMRARVAAFLETDLGTAMLAALLSAGLAAMPGGGDVPQRLSRELRVRAMADAGDVVADVLMGPLRQVMALYLRDVGPEVGVAPAHLAEGGAPRFESVPTGAAVTERAR